MHTELGDERAARLVETLQLHLYPASPEPQYRPVERCDRRVIPDVRAGEVQNDSIHMLQEIEVCEEHARRERREPAPTSRAANATANSIIWPDYFGVAALGSLKGVVTAVRNGATASGPPIAAVLTGSAGGFSSSVVLFVLLSLLAAAASLGMMRPAAATGAAGEPPGASRAAA